MVFGEERFFLIENSNTPPNISEFYLKFMGKDQYGVKMKGDFPKLWTIGTGKVHGPLLFDDDSIYEVVMIDYDNRLIWINRIFNGF